MEKNYKILDNLTSQQRRYSFLEKNYKNIIDEIKLKDDINFTKMIYNYRHNIIDEPICKICDNKTKFISYTKGYRDYCSKKCMMCDSTIVENRNKKSIITNIKKYGTDNPMKNKTISDKVSIANIEKTKKEREEINIKKRNTCLERYGKEYYFNTDEYKNKTKNTYLEKYNTTHHTKSDRHKDKMKKYYLETYGVDNFSKTDEYKNKTKNTYLEKYNTTHHTKSDRYKDKMKKYFSEKSLSYYNNLNSHTKVNDIENDNLYVYSKKCGHNFTIKKQLYYLRNKNNKEICTICNSTINKNSSYLEDEFYDFIKTNYNDEIIRNNKTIIAPYELDIYLPELKIAFEFNGLYWHSELFKDKNYHKEKTELCESKNIHLIHIYEDDWNYKNELIKSRILNLLGKSNKIYARKCEIKEVDIKTSKQFLEDNHIQNYTIDKIRIGLYYKSELLGLMCFGHLRKNLGQESKKNSYELLRFCNKINTVVIGGANKLFKYFIKNYKPKYIISYADRSWSKQDNNLYKNLGFEYVYKTGANYYYIVDSLKKNRFNFRKDVLIKEGFDPELTEYQIMIDRGYYRIYDSGSLKYEWYGDMNDMI